MNPALPALRRLLGGLTGGQTNCHLHRPIDPSLLSELRTLGLRVDDEPGRRQIEVSWGQQAYWTADGQEQRTDVAGWHRLWGEWSI